MEGGDAAPGDGGVVVARGVALVHLPAVGGVVGREAAHNIVPRSLGDDARRSDREELAVALHHALVRHERRLVMEAHGIGPPEGVGRLEIGIVGVEAVAVDDEELGSDGERADRTVHCQDAGVEYIETINLSRRGHAHCPRNRHLLNERAESLAPPLGQFLTVVETRKVGRSDVARQDDSRRHHGAGKAAAARLVGTGLDER